MKEYKLNERQRRFAEENHGVLLKFLKQRKLPIYVEDERVNICEQICEKLSVTPIRRRLLHTYSTNGRKYAVVRGGV